MPRRVDGDRHCQAAEKADPVPLAPCRYKVAVALFGGSNGDDYRTGQPFTLTKNKLEQLAADFR
jgi:hypothetical protein